MSEIKMNRNLKLVSVTQFIPFPGIPHAGGEYVRRHYSALSQYFDISVLAPATSDNIDAVRTSETVTSENVCWLHPGRALGQPMIKAIKLIRGVSLGADLEFSFSQQPELRDLISTADVIEFQWTETASLARRVRALAPAAKIVLVAHDIVSQRWSREAQTGSAGRRAFYMCRAFFTRLAERRRFLSVDTVIVFSEKDAGLAREIAPGSTVQTVNPPLFDEEMSDKGVSAGQSARSVLFTGAFSRPENHEGAMWLLSAIWPRVLESVPEARLVLAGADPLPELQTSADKFEGVTITGYVPELGPYYRSADVFVAPLLHGAGVKFKNITAMLWGVPILTTPIGAEGIGSDRHYLGVTADPEAFAAALVESLENAPRRRVVAAESLMWAQGRYGRSGFMKSLEEVYL